MPQAKLKRLWTFLESFRQKWSLWKYLILPMGVFRNFLAYHLDVRICQKLFIDPLDVQERPRALVLQKWRENLRFYIFFFKFFKFWLFLMFWSLRNRPSQKIAINSQMAFINVILRKKTPFQFFLLKYLYSLFFGLRRDIWSKES